MLNGLNKKNTKCKNIKFHNCFNFGRNSAYEYTWILGSEAGGAYFASSHVDENETIDKYLNFESLQLFDHFGREHH